jgi:molybdopterin converting factor small subunit
VNVRVTLYGPLRGVTGTKTVELSLSAGDEGSGSNAPPTVGDLVRAFADRYPRSRDQLLTEDGEIRPSVRVLCDGEKRERSEPASGEVSLFPAMRGG